VEADAEVVVEAEGFVEIVEADFVEDVGVEHHVAAEVLPQKFESSGTYSFISALIII
jgi:hypothetical protein